MHTYVLETVAVQPRLAHAYQAGSLTVGIGILRSER